MSTWLIVADNSTARIFAMETRSSPIDEIETLVHTEARLHEQNMTSDLPGKDSGNNGGSHAFQDKTDPKKQEMIDFSKRVADYLDEARKTNKLNKLHIIAAPAFLGELRSHLTKETGDRVVFTLDKNLVRHSEEDIRSQLPKIL